MPNPLPLAFATFILGVIFIFLMMAIYAGFVVDQCGWDDLVARFQSGYRYGYAFCTPQQ